MSRHLWLGFFLVCLLRPLLAEPGVAVLLDSRQPGQADLTARAKRFCYLLIKQNQLPDFQFSLKTLDLATPAGRQFAREMRLTERDLPALGYYHREGNRITLRNLVRRYGDPQQAAEDVFRCAQAEFPELVTNSRVITGARLSTEPSGASVREREIELGVTPCQVELAPGRHELVLVQPDCAPESRTLNLKAGDNPELSLELTPAPAEVSFQSEGEPVELELDGLPVGSTPLTLSTTAGPHALRATAPGYFPLEGDLHAAPSERSLARLALVPVRVKVGWAGLEAEGYQDSYTSYYYPVSYSWGRHCRGWSSSYAVPYTVDTSVSLSAAQLTEKAQAVVLERPGLALLEVAQGWDCGLKIQVQADRYQVVGELAVLDARGVRIQTFRAQRDMPWLSFDTEGAARKRAAQVVQELLDQGLAWVHDNVQPGPPTAAENAEALRISSQGPLNP